MSKSTDMKAELEQILELSRNLTPVKGRRVLRLLNEAGQVCDALEIVSQINECKATVRFTPLSIFCQAMVNEFEYRIMKAFPWSKDRVLANRLKFFIFMKIRFATRRLPPKLFFGRLDPNLQSMHTRQKVGELA